MFANKRLLSILFLNSLTIKTNICISYNIVINIEIEQDKSTISKTNKKRRSFLIIN